MWTPAAVAGASASTVARWCGLIFVAGFVLALKRYGSWLSSLARGGSQYDLWDSLKRKSSLTAPRNAPLRTGRKPGAETALFLYHPYFSGAQRPDGQWI